eukprot:573869-Pelagomonas_calceolata.AAC.1
MGFDLQPVWLLGLLNLGGSLAAQSAQPGRWFGCSVWLLGLAARSAQPGRLGMGKEDSGVFGLASS